LNCLSGDNLVTQFCYPPQKVTVGQLKEWENLSVVVGTKKCSYIGEIHNAPKYENASCKLTVRHFWSCGKWMTRCLWVLVERLNVCVP